MSSLYEYEKYICSAETLQAKIDEYGVAIIPNVLSAEECEQMSSGMWEYLSHITQTWPKPICKNNKSSYKEYLELHPIRLSMLHQHSIGHAQFIWNLRQNINVLRIFATFWKVEPDELLSSFDGATFAIPNLVPTRGERNKEILERADKPWYHVDQSFARVDFELIQSWINAYDTEEGDATLAFLEGSHKYFHEWAASQISYDSKMEWNVLKPNDMQFYLSRGCVEKRVRCPKGSLVLWDSRLVHYGASSTKRGQHDERFRLVAYLCYKPRSFISSEELAKKVAAFQAKNTCSHNPVKVVPFPNKPRKKMLHDITPIPHPTLSSLGYKLAGF